jgi:hypothetical protein
VDAGDAEFVTFTQKKYTFTPKSSSKKQKVEGNIITGDDAMVEITSLHFDSDRDVYIGNVHLKWKGEVDEDGIGGREAMAHHGVNVHLEANGNCTAP